MSKSKAQRAADQYAAKVREAEAAAQRSVCHIPDGELPEDLATALELRVEANLAAGDGKTVTRSGGADPEVRALEAPYSKRKPTGSV